MTARVVRHGILLLAACCGGCSGRQTPAGAYSHFTDRMRAASGLSGILLDYPCTFKIGSDVTARKPDSECYKLAPPQRLSGVWVNAFEGSEFYPGATAEPPAQARGLWLEFEHREPLLVAWRSKDPTAAVLALDLIGRRTLVRGRYGHMGGWAEEIVVDRVLAARAIR